MLTDVQVDAEIIRGRNFFRFYGKIVRIMVDKNIICFCIAFKGPSIL